MRHVRPMGKRNSQHRRSNRAIRLEDDLEAFEDNIHLAEQQTKDAMSKPAMEAPKQVEPELPREPVSNASAGSVSFGEPSQALC